MIDTNVSAKMSNAVDKRTLLLELLGVSNHLPFPIFCIIFMEFLFLFIILYIKFIYLKINPLAYLKIFTVY